MDLFLKANCKANFLPKDTQHRLLVRGYEWGCQGMGSLVLFTRPEKRSQTLPPPEASIPDPHGGNLEVTGPANKTWVCPVPDYFVLLIPWTGNWR